MELVWSNRGVPHCSCGTWIGTYKTPKLQGKLQLVMTPIRRTGQREHLGDYNISCEASEELDNDQRYFYQQGFFSRLA